MTWQGLTTGGSPDPTRANTSPAVAVLDIGILVFREGLECILVLAAITASMTGTRRACAPWWRRFVPHRRQLAGARP